MFSKPMIRLRLPKLSWSIITPEAVMLCVSLLGHTFTIQEEDCFSLIKLTSSFFRSSWSLSSKLLRSFRAFSEPVHSFESYLSLKPSSASELFRDFPYNLLPNFPLGFFLLVQKDYGLSPGLGAHLASALPSSCIFLVLSHCFICWMESLPLGSHHVKQLLGTVFRHALRSTNLYLDNKVLLYIYMV